MAVFRFFCSYAHADARVDNFLRDFYKALSVELKRTMGANEEGFFDEASIPIGGTWPRSLEGALRTTKCVLSFYSPGYFNSTYSGKEVKAFQLRIEKYRQLNADSDPTLLLGVCWESGLNVNQIIPSSLAQVQFGVPPLASEDQHGVQDDLNRTKELNQMMRQHGLRMIMQKKETGSPYYRLAFLDIVERYAAYIRRSTTQFDISNCGFSETLKDLVPDFPVERSPEEAASLTSASSPKGPKFARVLFVVGKPDAFAAVKQRKNLSPYDDSDERLWRPFLPAADAPIGSLVAEVIASEKMVADWVKTPAAPDANTFRKIVEQAMTDKNVLVVMVDPWSVFVPELQTSLGVLDKTRLTYGTMFLPWNDEDDEMKKYSATLQEELERTFEALTADNAAVLSEIVCHSWGDLANQLRAKLAVIRSRIVAAMARQGQIRPLPPGSSLPNASVPVR